MRQSTTTPRDEGPSRADVEALILVQLVGERGCDPATLTERLQLAPNQLPAVQCAVQAMEERGWLTVTEGKILPTYAGLAAQQHARERWVRRG